MEIDNGHIFNSFRSLCRLALCSLVVSLTSLSASADVVFNQWFDEATLRVDYVFAGDSVKQEISLDQLGRLPYWAGRRMRLDSLCLEGNGQLLMRDEATGRLIYATSFSTLFQEWQHTPEALSSFKSFENSFLLPFPRKPVLLTVQLRDSHRHITASRTQRVNPEDILIRRYDQKCPYPVRYIVKSGSPEACIDVAVVAEGYTKRQMKQFYRDVEQFAAELFRHEPYTSLKDRFNIVAVGAPSKDEGASVPHDGVWKETLLGSHFDTFYSQRYLTTLNLKKLQDVLTGVPYEHVIVLVNTEVYGGGGIYNLYMLSASHHKYSLPVEVHEFGHSFAGLADEYATDDGNSEFYHPDVEPWERNVTTLADFSSKWQDMVPAGTPVPTPVSPDEKKNYTRVGVFEGAGYQSRGVYRPAADCRMRVNDVPAFCPVCQREIERVIRFYTH